MPGESFFMAFGGIGISLAGFAGLIFALDRSPGSRSPIAAYRVRNIAVLGFWLTVTGLGTVAIHTATSDVELAIRIGTVFLGVVFVRGVSRDLRPGPAWPDERYRRMSMLLGALMLAVVLPNVVVASPGYLELLMIMGLLGPISIFYNTIHAASAPESADPAP